MAFDAHLNFAYSTVATAPSPATSGTSLVVQSGDGAKFPTAPFNATVWPIHANPLTSNAEIVRVTNISTDTLTIVRTQESSSARSIIIGDQIAATITEKTLTDIETLLADSGWQTFSFANSWANYTGGSTPVAGYRKIGNIVYLRGGIVSGSSGTSAFTLPTGYQPTGTQTFPLGDAGGFSQAVITSAGLTTIFIQTGSTPVFLDGVNFTVN